MKRSVFKKMVLMCLFSIIISVVGYSIPANSMSSNNSTFSNNLSDELQQISKHELTDKRTLNSKTFESDNGEIIQNMYFSPIHFEDKEGNFRDINLQLTDEADINLEAQPVSRVIFNNDTKLNSEVSRANTKPDRGNTSFRSLQTPYDVKIPKKIGNGYTFSTEKEQISLTPIGTNDINGVLDESNENRVIYPESWTDTDLILDLQNNGLKETIVLESSKSPTLFSFEVTGDLKSDFRAESYQILPAWLEDSQGTRRDVEQNFRTEQGKSYIDLVVDVTNLSFPIYVDPTIVLISEENIGHDVTISPSFISYGQDYELTVFSGSQVRYTLLQFPNLSNLSSQYPNHTVTSATLKMYLDSNSGNLNQFNVHRITSPWTENAVTWSNRPSFDSTILSSFQNNINLGWYSINVTSSVQQILAGNQQNYGWLIKSANDTLSNNLYFFSSEAPYHYGAGEFVNPYLQVVLEQASNTYTPNLLSPNGGEQVSGVYKIEWSNPSNQPNLQYQIELSRDSGRIWTPIGTLTAIGALSDTYDFSSIDSTTTALIRVRAYNGSSYSPYDVSNNEFSIKKLEPNETFSNAISIDYDTRYETKISTASDIDYYKVVAPMNGTNVVGLKVPNISTLNYNVEVYNSQFVKIKAGMNGPQTEEEVMFPVTAGATYYIKVYSALGSSNEYTYQLRLTNAVLYYTYTSQNTLDTIYYNGGFYRYIWTYKYDKQGNLLSRKKSVISI